MVPPSGIARKNYCKSHCVATAGLIPRAGHFHDIVKRRKAGAAERFTGLLPAEMRRIRSKAQKYPVDFGFRIATPFGSEQQLLMLDIACDRRQQGNFRHGVDL